MQVYVLSRSAAVKKAFAAVERSRTYTLAYADPDEFAGVCREADGLPESFVYVDVAGMELRVVKRRLAKLRKDRPYRFGFVDSGNTVADIAELFHGTAADYVGKTLLKEGITTAHMRRVVEFEPEPFVRPADTMAEADDLEIRPSADWNQIEDGAEYTFVMLYAGLDRTKELRRKSSESFLATLRKTFTSLLERTFADAEAKVWMWMEDDGLLLIPYDGREVSAIVPAIRLAISRALYNFDEFAQFGEQSWRLAVHLGNTHYQVTGSTGEIVSESVNFLFHLGQQFTRAGGLTVTHSCMRRLPSRVRPLFTKDGQFEGVDVYTLRDLI